MRRVSPGKSNKLSNESSNIVILRTYDASHLAHLDEAKLADEGIESFIQDENIVAINPLLTNAFGGIKLLVFEQDVAKATDTLGLNEFDSLKDVFVDDLEPQPSCPDCGSTEVIQRKSILSGILYLLLFFVPVAVPTKKYFCAKCGHTWKMT